MKVKLLSIIYALLAAASLCAQPTKHDIDVLSKKLEDVLWYEKVGDAAFVDKVRLAGPAKTNPKQTGCEFLDSLSDNQLIFYSYVFIPKNAKQSKKYPLVVFVHGGIHGTFTTAYSHIIKEFIAQGYIVVSPDYRGSIGYGKDFYEAIDYGGAEVEDVLAATQYMLKNYSIVDKDRVGVFGWSHGGMISLLSAAKYPDVYKCAFAGVPVSDVAYRLTYQKDDYTDNFTADYHIGKTPEQAPEEYARRSPVTYAKDIRIPLMINTVKNDDDVSWTEVQRMADALTANGKEFIYKVYEPLPGAHIFERLDTDEACAIRIEAYQFINQYLQPRKPFKSVSELRKAGYGWK